MSAKYSLKMYDANGNCRTEETCFYFRYVKEIYTPYAYFECRFLSSVDDIGEINRIEFWIYSKLVHRGLVDSIEISHSNNRCTVFVRSKGFTSLLCQNQPEPGIMADVNLAKILAVFPEIPYITGENTENENYIYIKDGSTIWDCICNLGFRLKGIYPYIEGDNHIRISPKTTSSHIYLVDSLILATGEKHDFTRLVSHIHMQDIDGNYNTYNQSSQAATSRNIFRHKQISLDRQFLYSPESAPDYKLKYSMRGMTCTYIKYAGYYNEDLYDKVTYGSMKGEYIHSVEVVFDGGTPVTTLGSYSDGFFT